MKAKKISKTKFKTCFHIHVSEREGGRERERERERERKFKACFHTRKKNNEPDDLYRKILAQEISREKNDNDNNKEMMKI